MKLTTINGKTLKPLRDIIAYKWLKVDKLKKASHIIIPDTIHDGTGLDRMGNKYTCEVLAVGPDANILKVGDRFLLHEYDKTDQGIKWNADDVMFVEEKAVSIMLDKNTDPFMVPAKKITDKMVDEYEEY